MTRLTDDEYKEILEFRTAIRRFLEWSGQQAIAVGITPTQHQLLLAIRGTDHHLGLTIRDVADILLLKHHSAVELIDRAVDHGLVERRQDASDRRLVRVRLTRKGEAALARVTAANLEELMRLGPKLTRLFGQFHAVSAS